MHELRHLFGKNRVLVVYGLWLRLRCWLRLLLHSNVVRIYDLTSPWINVLPSQRIDQQPSLRIQVRLQRSLLIRLWRRLWPSLYLLHDLHRRLLIGWPMQIPVLLAVKVHNDVWELLNVHLLGHSHHLWLVHINVKN